MGKPSIPIICSVSYYPNRGGKSTGKVVDHGSVGGVRFREQIADGIIGAGVEGGSVYIEPSIVLFILEN